MSRPTRAKYCPRCHAMNFQEAETCVHCGHEFRTGVTAPPPMEESLHRTQMFTLPPLARPPEPGGTRPPQGAGARSRAAHFLAALRASPLFPAIVLLALAVLGLLCWAAIAAR